MCKQRENTSKGQGKERPPRGESTFTPVLRLRNTERAQACRAVTAERLLLWKGACAARPSGYQDAGDGIKGPVHSDSSAPWQDSGQHQGGRGISLVGAPSTHRIKHCGLPLRGPSSSQPRATALRPEDHCAVLATDPLAGRAPSNPRAEGEAPTQPVLRE